MEFCEKGPSEAFVNAGEAITVPSPLGPRSTDFRLAKAPSEATISSWKSNFVIITRRLSSSSSSRSNVHSDIHDFRLNFRWLAPVLREQIQHVNAIPNSSNELCSAPVQPQQDAYLVFVAATTTYPSMRRIDENGCPRASLRRRLTSRWRLHTLRTFKIHPSGLLYAGSGHDPSMETASNLIGFGEMAGPQHRRRGGLSIYYFISFSSCYLVLSVASS